VSAAVDVSPDPASVPIRPAATVMLVRDAADGEGLEVFMLRRTLSAAFASGMYVFPGGRVDDADHADELEAICDGLDDATASALLGIERGGLAFWVAAIRECFEEAGVLLARHVDGGSGPGDVVRFDDPEVAARFEAAREHVHGGTRSLVELCEAEGLVLTTDAMHFVSHWLTPVGESRRFDTRFFLARAPQAQEPLHDDTETIDSIWTRPGDALARHRAGELALLPPTIANLEFLLPHATADAAMAAGAAVGTPPLILPKLRLDANGRLVGVALPTDPDYPSLP
jgi:8-oxo-dGTP pyrophosphatase MutT (NUDIX family)